MELKWLLDFVSLANSGSFSHAAKERNVTQSAFSRRIRSLESWFGAELVDRSNYPVSLTEQGAGFLETARRMIRMAYKVRDELCDENSRTAATLDFSMASDLPAHFFPSWLRQMEPSIGRINARINSDFNGYLGAVDCLTQQKSDFLVSYDNTFNELSFDTEKFDALTISEDVLVPVCLKELQEGQSLRLPGTSERSLPYIGYIPCSFIGRALAEMFSHTKETIHLDTRYDSPSAEHIRNMVLQGFGIAWLNRLSIQNELDSGQLTCIGDSRFHIPLAIKIYRCTSNIKPEVTKTWEVLAGHYSSRSQIKAAQQAV